MGTPIPSDSIVSDDHESKIDNHCHVNLNVDRGRADPPSGDQETVNCEVLKLNQSAGPWNHE